MADRNTMPPEGEEPCIEWLEEGSARRAHWRSESGQPPPRRVVVVGDEISADDAWHLACEGTALLWRGDYHNARQLLGAIARRVDRKPPKLPQGAAPIELFNRHRLAQAQRARILGMLLVPVDADLTIPLRRAPDVREACGDAWGAVAGPGVVSLREMLGLIGAHEWRRKGIEIAALGGRIHPHYGVFSPLRAEYLGLVAAAPLPARALAFDIGTGTGVLAALLARRGVARVVATDCAPRALACARANIDALGLSSRVEVLEADLFPPGRAPLVVCNPPWLPARPGSPLEHAVYDADSRMLRGYLAGLGEHLAPGGEGWLILSDLAELLGLRSREQLLAWIDAAGLAVVARADARPTHRKTRDAADLLHRARAAELTSLWRLRQAD